MHENSEFIHSLFEPIQTLSRGERRLTAKKAVKLVVFRDADSEGFTASDDALDLTAFGDTREQAIEDAIAWIWFTWDEYAKADPETLTLAAQRLREHYLETFTEETP